MPLCCGRCVARVAFNPPSSSPLPPFSSSLPSPPSSSPSSAKEPRAGGCESGVAALSAACFVDEETRGAGGVSSRSFRMLRVLSRCCWPGLALAFGRLVSPCHGLGTSAGLAAWAVMTLRLADRRAADALKSARADSDCAAPSSDHNCNAFFFFAWARNAFEVLTVKSKQL